MCYNILAKQKTNIYIRRTLFFMGVFYPRPNCQMNLVKAQIPLVDLVSYPINLFFVWRQLESAFFGALTSVGALFYFREERDLLWKKKLFKGNLESHILHLWYVV